MRRELPSAVIKRSVVINGHKTSVSMETEFWTAFKNIAMQKGVAASVLATEIDAGRQQSNLSSAVRIYILKHYRAAAGGYAAPDDQDAK